ncbi:MAG: 4Fe-4S binding protein [Planctomycetota bacterium]|nr:4Fe-4S binding protein [Planctomycetota bacterium]
MKQRTPKRIEVRPERCAGCLSCELACAVAHSKSKTVAGAAAERPRPRARVKVVPAAGFCVPMACRHCAEAPCVVVCPTKALSRKDTSDPVLLAVELCIGCRACAMVCPFGAISADEDGRAVLKCDLCANRTAEGLEPACVSACPTGAIRYVEVEVVAAEKRRTAAEDMVAASEAARGKAPPVTAGAATGTTGRKSGEPEGEKKKA